MYQIKEKPLKCLQGSIESTIRFRHEFVCPHPEIIIRQGMISPQNIHHMMTCQVIVTFFQGWYCGRNGLQELGHEDL